MRSAYKRAAYCCAWLLLSCGASQSPRRVGTDGAVAHSSTRDASAAAACEPASDCDASVARSPAATGQRGLCTQSGDCEEAIAIKSAQHMSGTIDYPDPPPAGGNHNPCWGTWGVHTQALPAENWVHNLEHGGVVLLYHCKTGCASEVSQLTSFVSAHHRTILTAYDAMPKRFAIVAWGYRLQSDTLDLAAFETFYSAHFDHAPESIDSGPSSGCP